MFDPAEIIAGLPHLPGVYRMLNAAGEALYVGKALDLRKRVASYFQKHVGPVAAYGRCMVSRSQRIETTVTRSEGEALLLENNLIKSLARATTSSSATTSPIRISSSRGHEFPRLGFHRGASIRAIATSARSRTPAPCATAFSSCRRFSGCAPARTPSSATARARACCTRSGAAPRRAWGSSARPSYAEDVEAPSSSFRARRTRSMERLAARMADRAERLEFEQAADLPRPDRGAAQGAREAVRGRGIAAGRRHHRVRAAQAA